MITPGPRGKELITQAYFESMVPPEFRGYMRGRETQLVHPQRVGKNRDLVNGGRRINFNIILEDRMKFGTHPPIHPPLTPDRKSNKPQSLIN